MDKTTAILAIRFTATQTEAGVQWLKDNPTEKCGIYPMKAAYMLSFSRRGYKQQASEADCISPDPDMYICDECIFGAKKKAKNRGTDKEFTYMEISTDR